MKKNLRLVSVLLVVVIVLAAVSSVTVSAKDLTYSVHGGVSRTSINGNLNNCSFPEGIGTATVGEKLYLNVACGTGLYLKTLTIKDNGTTIVSYSVSGNSYWRWHTEPYTPKTTGKHELEFTITDANNTYSATRTLEVKSDKYVAQGIYVAPGKYHILSAMNNNKALDMPNFAQEDITQAVLWDFNGGDNQIVEVSLLDNGYYVLKMVHSGKYLNVYGGYTTQTTDLIQYHWDGTVSNYFYFEDAGNGNVYIKAYNGQTIDLRAGDTSNGTLIDCYIDFHGGTNQQWKLKKVEESLVWPVPDSYTITTLYYYNTYRNGAKHDGYTNSMDIGVKLESPVVAAFSGTVTKVVSGYDNDDLRNNKGKGYGNYIKMNGDDGSTMLYGHLTDVEVKEGQHVTIGQKIGTSGNSGDSTGPHLHFSWSLGNPYLIFRDKYSSVYCDPSVFQSAKKHKDTDSNSKELYDYLKGLGCYN